jgi:hypothetical protein
METEVASSQLDSKCVETLPSDQSTSLSEERLCADVPFKPCLLICQLTAYIANPYSVRANINGFCNHCKPSSRHQTA